MSAIQYFRHIVFRDKDLTRWEVDIEVRPAQMMRNENGKWVYYDGPIEVSFSGSGGRGCGQIVDHINPRTKFQQLLKEYWNRYHCICQNRQPLPDNYIILFNDLCNCIEADERKYTANLPYVFDMGDEEFEPTEETVEQVMELRDCDKDEARRFIALGMFLGCTFGDLDESFEADANWPNQYSAFGTDYLVDTDDELTDAARNYIFDEGCYDDLWRQAVQAQQTELGLEDWLNDVLDNDGWCNILNHYDGKYEEYTVGKDIICVSRT